jgi:hypothetical protein
MLESPFHIWSLFVRTNHKLSGKPQDMYYSFSSHISI